MGGQRARECEDRDACKQLLHGSSSPGLRDRLRCNGQPGAT
jgi:hypothetical protein